MSDIKLSTAMHIVPGLLKNRLKKMGITYLAEVKDIDVLAFGRMKGVGEKAVKQLLDFQAWLHENEQRVLAEQLKIIDLERCPDLAEVRFSNIESFVPSLLMAKFDTCNIQRVKDLAKYSKIGFAQLESVGSGTMQKLDKFIPTLYAKQEELLYEHKLKEEGCILPEDANLNEDILTVLEAFTKDYLRHLERVGVKKLTYFMRLFYAIGEGYTERKSMDEIAALVGRPSKERIRQIIREELLSDLCKVLLRGESSTYLKLYAHAVLQDKIKEVLSFLLEKKAIIKEEFLEQMEHKFGVVNIDEKKTYLSLLLSIIDIRQLPQSIIKTFSQHTTVYITPLLDEPSQSNDYSLSRTGRHVFNALKKLIVPATKEEVVAEVQAIDSNYSAYYVEVILNTFPEIRKLTSIEGEAHYFQIQLEKLSSAGAMLERILYEKGTEMQIDEAVAEINRCLPGDEAKINKEAAVSNASSNVEKLSIGTVYRLKQWEGHSKSIVELLKEVMETTTEELSMSEIIERIKALDSNKRASAIRAVVRTALYKTGAGLFSLANWKKKYASRMR